MYIKIIGNRLLLFLSPPFCTCCKLALNERVALCNICRKAIKPLVSTKIQVTKKYHLQVFCVGAYQEPLKQLILAKGRSDKLACYYMAQLIQDYTSIKPYLYDYIVPIPLHWTRYAKRGYNQAEQIAHYLAIKTGIPIFHALKRIKRTPFQSTCDKNSRMQNVQDAFALMINESNKVKFKHKRLLLVDDLMTTGATLKAASQSILALKPAIVHAVVCARTS